MPPAAIGPYSQAMVSGGFVFTSGQIPIDPATGAVIDGNVTVQTEQVMANLGAVLAAAGSDFSKVVKATCFLASMDDFADFKRRLRQIHDEQAGAFLRRGQVPAEERSLRGRGHRGGLGGCLASIKLGFFAVLYGDFFCIE